MREEKVDVYKHTKQDLSASVTQKFTTQQIHRGMRFCWVKSIGSLHPHILVHGLRCADHVATVRRWRSFAPRAVLWLLARGPRCAGHHSAASIPTREPESNEQGIRDPLMNKEGTQVFFWVLSTHAIFF